MYTVTVWDKHAQKYRVVESGTRFECDEWVKTRRMIGDRRTYLVRRG